MTNHDMLAFIYESGPCTHYDIEFAFGCSQAKIAIVSFELMVSGLLSYDPEGGLFKYSRDSWVAQP